MKSPIWETELARLRALKQEQTAQHHFVNIRTKGEKQHEKKSNIPALIVRMFMAGVYSLIALVALFGVFNLLKLWWR